MSDSSLRLGSTTESHQRQDRRPGWLKPGLWLVMLMLILGLTIAGSAGSDIKATTRAGQVVGKDGRAWPASTDFQFTGQGRILGGVGNTWLVSGVPIQVDEHTQIIGTLNAGDTVVLSGRILKSGVWLADRIGQADLQQPVFTFNGLLLSVESGAWRIGNTTLAVNEQSEVDNELVVNDPVLATFTPLESGTWLALKIELFDEPWIEPTPIPTSTPTASPEVIKDATSAKSNPEPSTKPPKNKADPPKKAKPKHSTKPQKNQEKTVICHNPHKKGAKTMTVDNPALQSHLGHGDTYGPCR